MRSIAVRDNGYGRGLVVLNDRTNGEAELVDLRAKIFGFDSKEAAEEAVRLANYVVANKLAKTVADCVQRMDQRNHLLKDIAVGLLCDMHNGRLGKKATEEARRSYIDEFKPKLNILGYDIDLEKFTNEVVEIVQGANDDHEVTNEIGRLIGIPLD